MTSTQVQTNPFPGLRPFEADENHLFFGRDGQSDEILRRLRRNRFLAVVGTSGSGKSSLIRAGLLPLLYGGFMTRAGSRWRVAIFRPGSDPIGNLALALNAHDVLEKGNDGDIPHVLITETTLRRSALGLINVLRQARLPSQENLLVVVDQFEELFRFKQSVQGQHSEDDSAAFVKLLLEAARQNELPSYVVITMRSDFLGDCAQFRDLPEAGNEGLYLIPRMTRDQRREAITGPVAVGGTQISPRLVNRLLNEVGDNPDQLPTLQHALMRTWDYWSQHHEAGEPLDFRHYEAIGGMAEALSRHADEAYFELPSDRHRALAEKLFKSLTEKGPDNREIRRPMRLQDLCAIAEADEAEVIAVIESFRHSGRSFLMPPADVALDADSLIDISHESLIRGWHRLTDWVAGEALSAGIYRRTAETAVLHKEGKAGLWRDPDLQVALGWREQTRPNRAWAQRYHPQFDTAMEFLDESQSARDAEVLETERGRKKNLRRAWLFTIILGLAFIASSLLGIHANRQQKIAQEQTALAERRAQEAERAEQVTNQEKERAEKLAGHIRHQALRLRKSNLQNHSTLVYLADKLIAYSPPQEIALWRNIKARSLSEMGDHERAIAEYTAVLKNNPELVASFRHRRTPAH
jgi:energy-coupling factor transporter ATP-binding protein EcfA2